MCKPDTFCRIGLFGGVFNPPHLGHLRIAEACRDRLGLDLVYWIPAARPPHKSFSASDPTPEDRRDLVEAVIRNHPAFRLLGIELDRSGPSWSIETVREVAALHPEDELVFILGADALAGLATWRAPEELCRLVTFAVYDRAGAAGAAPAGARVVRVAGPELCFSSSAVREDLRIGRSTRYIVPEGAARIIDARGLYLPELPEGLQCHIRETTSAAAALARRWSLSEPALVLAARYHDIYRALPGEELIAMAERLGEAIDEHERREPILLHGRLAARRLLSLGLDDPDGERDLAASAVRRHVTGAASMTPEEETLIVADRVGKDWRRVEEVPANRRVAVAEALRGKIDTVRRRGFTPHPRMVAALQACDEGPAAC